MPRCHYWYFDARCHAAASLRWCCDAAWWYATPMMPRCDAVSPPSARLMFAFHDADIVFAALRWLRARCLLFHDMLFFHFFALFFEPLRCRWCYCCRYYAMEFFFGRYADADDAAAFHALTFSRCRRYAIIFRLLRCLSDIFTLRQAMFSLLSLMPCHIFIFAD